VHGILLFASISIIRGLVVYKFILLYVLASRHRHGKVSGGPTGLSFVQYVGKEISHESVSSTLPSYFMSVELNFCTYCKASTFSNKYNFHFIDSRCIQLNEAVGLMEVVVMKMYPKCLTWVNLNDHRYFQGAAYYQFIRQYIFTFCIIIKIYLSHVCC
jgi:hypothetical protein